MRLRRPPCIALALSLAPAVAWAADLFQVNVTVQNPPFTPSQPGRQTYTFSNTDAALNAFENRGGVPTVFSNTPGYENTSAAFATGRLRGVPVSASFAQNSTALTFSVPSAGVGQTFTGPTREASAQALADYLNAQGNSLLNRALPRTFSDPVIGNPTSLGNRMVARDFLSATGIGDFEADVSPDERGGGYPRTPNALTLGGELGYASSGGTNIFTATIPAEYKVFFSNPRYSLNFDLPVSYLEIGGAQVGQASFGTSFRFPVSQNWSFAVSARAGITGSEDLLEGDVAFSGAVSSIYDLYFGDYRVRIGNSVGALNTQPVRIGKFNSGPRTTNIPIVNGASLEGSLPFTVLDKPASYEVYVVDTYLPGDRLALQHYDEVGVNVGTRRVLGSQSWNTARVGLAYTFGDSFNLVSLRFSYRF